MTSFAASRMHFYINSDNRFRIDSKFDFNWYLLASPKVFHWKWQMNSMWLLDFQRKNCSIYPIAYKGRKWRDREQTATARLTMKKLLSFMIQLISKRSNSNMTDTAYCCPSRRLPHTHWCAQKDSFYPPIPDPNFILSVGTRRPSHSTCCSLTFRFVISDKSAFPGSKSRVTCVKGKPRKMSSKQWSWTN